MSLYRDLCSSSWTEEELWLRLDDALERAMDDPVWSWGVAWMVARDAADFPAVRIAAEGLMAILHPATVAPI